MLQQFSPHEQVVPFKVLALLLLGLSVASRASGQALPPPTSASGDATAPAALWIDLRSHDARFDGRTNDTAALNQAIVASCQRRFMPMWTPSGIGVFVQPPKSIGCGAKIFGAGSRSSNDNGGTNFLFTYNGASPSAGDLQWDGSGPGDANGVGGGLWHATLEAATGVQHGAFVSLTGTRADCSNSRAGHMNFTDVLLGGGNQHGTRDHAVYVDGTCASQAGSAGIRDVEWHDVWFTDATAPDQTVLCRACVHHHFSGGQVYEGFGAHAGITITGGAGANQFSDDVRMDKLTVYGNVVMDYARNSEFDGLVTGDMTITEHAQHIRVAGQVGGTITDRGIDTLLVTNQRISVPVSKGGAAGFINAGATPPGIVGGDVAAARSATNGCLWLGSDGKLSVCRTPEGRVTFSAGLQAPISFSGQAQTDGVGEIQIAQAFAASVAFSNVYRTPPLCTITPTSDPTAVGAFWITTTTVSLTVHVHAAGTIAFVYRCEART